MSSQIFGYRRGGCLPTFQSLGNSLSSEGIGHAGRISYENDPVTSHQRRIETALKQSALREVAGRSRSPVVIYRSQSGNERIVGSAENAAVTGSVDADTNICHVRPDREDPAVSRA
jgi:hypothetical protein